MKHLAATKNLKICTRALGKNLREFQKKIVKMFNNTVGKTAHKKDLSNIYEFNNLLHL